MEGACAMATTRSAWCASPSSAAHRSGDARGDGGDVDGRRQKILKTATATVFGVNGGAFHQETN